MRSPLLDVERAIALLGGGRAIALSEAIPHHTQRLYKLVNADSFSKRLYKDLVKAEESIYHDNADPMVNWDEDDILPWFEAAGFKAEIQVEQRSTMLPITAKMLERWFSVGREKPSYGDRLSEVLSTKGMGKVQQVFIQQLKGQTVMWGGAIAFIVGWLKPD